MLVTPVQFAATLNARLDKGARQLPLSASDEAKLMAAVGDEEYTYLVLRDPTGAEIVKVENTCNTLLVTRGQDGTDDRNVPRGSCVRFEMVPAIVKDLICNYNCCDGDCPCEAVAAAGITLSPAKVGESWQGSAVFTGDTPMTIAVEGAPSWAKVEVGANFVNFSGVATGAGTFNISVAATNCDGHVAVQQGTLNVTA